MLEKNPVFGEKIPGKTYQTRLGVYGIVERGGLFCLVQAPNGAWFLPGGEIEAGEDHPTALKRELLEEVGATVDLGLFYGQADEYFYSSHRETYFYNPAYIYQTLNLSLDHKPLEDFNSLGWFPYEQALDLLKRDSHKWGLTQHGSQAG